MTTTTADPTALAPLPGNVFDCALRALFEGADAADDGAPALLIRDHSVQIHDVATTWWVTRAAWQKAFADLGARDTHDGPPPATAEERGQIIADAYAVFCDAFADVVCFNGADVGDTFRVVEALARDGVELLRGDPARYADAVRAAIFGHVVSFYAGAALVDPTPELVDAWLRGENEHDGRGIVARFVGR